MSTGLSLEVIDPANRTGKIVIPMKYVTETRGVIDFRKNPAKRDGKDLSLCLLHQRGRCKADDRCHQVHADSSFVEQLRAKAAAGSNCCATHGDCHSTGYLALTDDVPAVALADGERGTKRYPIASFGRTQLMDTLLRNRKGPEVRTTANKVCRLHLQSRCKFGRDCKNVHLCRDAKEITATEEAPATAVTAPPSPLPFPDEVLLGSSGMMKAPTPLDGSSTCCGISDRCSMTEESKSSSRQDSPLETSIFVPSYSTSTRCATLDDSVFSVTAPLSAWAAPQHLPSPAFDASGFEDTLRSLREEFADL